jgi:hypothetical protein
MSRFIVAPETIARMPAWARLGATLVFAALAFAGLYLAVQDYQTSRAGYLLIPTTKLDAETTATIVGFLPQAFSMALMWVYANRPRGRALVVVLWMLVFIPDFGTDFYFKVQGITWTGVFLDDAIMGLLAVAETFFLFTAGSEFILIFGWANLSPLVGPVFGPMLTGIWQGLGDWYRERTKAVASGVGPLMGADDDFTAEDYEHGLARVARRR